MLKTATIVDRGHRSRTLLNQVSFIRPFSENVLSPLRAILLFFILALVLNSSIYSSSTISKRDAIVTEKQLLD